VNKPRPAIFVDKDGTLVPDVPHNVNPDLVELSQGALPAMQIWDAAGFALVVVTNQPGVARGFYSEEAVRAVEARLRTLLAEGGVPLAGFFYCPHHPEGVAPGYALVCRCRKPAPGLLLYAADQLSLDLPRSWMVGDILDDVEAGRRAGVRTVLLDNGNETEWTAGPERQPHFVARTLTEAAQVIQTASRSGTALRGEEPIHVA
jgi:D-glycero-D-manno-heptose 1,7-bisphosphate phosphatase